LSSSCFEIQLVPAEGELLGGTPGTRIEVFDGRDPKDGGAKTRQRIFIGPSIFRELRLMVDAGMSPAQVLNHYVTGTNPVVSLYIQKFGTNVTLIWLPGTLQSATNVVGPYTDVSGAVSPYMPKSLGAQSFYRVRVR